MIEGFPCNSLNFRVGFSAGGARGKIMYECEGSDMSDVQLQENIETYLYAVNEIRNSINVIQGEKYIENHKKTLLFSVIDLLAKGVYGNSFGNRRTDMFEKFILEFCEWGKC